VRRARQCRATRPGNCTSTPPLASYGTPLGGHHGGLYDDVVRVPWASYSLTPVSEQVPSEIAVSCSDQMVDAYHAVAPTLQSEPGAHVLVVGGTLSLGLWTVMFAAALGAGEVVYADSDPAAAELAATLGATRTVVGPIPDRVDGEFQLSVDVGGDPERTLGCAFRSVAPGGTIVGRCVYFGDPPLPYWDMYRTDARFVTSLPHATPYVAEVLDLLRTGAADPRGVLTTGLAYEDAPEILLDGPRKPVFVRPAATTA
jgi:alcohol dehydrogenase